MPPNSLYCWDHKRAVDSLTSQRKATDKKNKNTECMDALNSIREEGKSGPPSKFSETIIEFEASAPSLGRGIKRKTIDSFQLLERYITRTSVRNEARLQRMHEEQWMNHAKTVMLLSHQEAEARWQKAKEITPEKLTDEEGPNKTLRLPMHVEDAIFVGSGVDFEKISEGACKRKKLKDDEQIADEALKMQTDHVGFKDELLSKVGGAAALQIACNSSGVVSSGCLGSFGEVSVEAQSKGGGRRQQGSSGASTSESASPLPAALMQGTLSPSPSATQKPGKAGKTWDVATQRLKLQNEMQEKFEAVQAKAQKMLEACFAAAEKTLPRCFGQNTVRNQINYLVIMQNKVDVLQLVRQARHTEFQRVVMSQKLASEFGANIAAVNEFLEVMDKLEKSQSGSGEGEGCWTDANHQVCLAVVKVLPCFTKYHDLPQCNIFSFFGWDDKAKHFTYALSSELQKTLQEELKAVSSCWTSAQDALQSKPMLLSKCVEACTNVLKTAAASQERASAVQTLSMEVNGYLKHDATRTLGQEQIMSVLSKHGWTAWDSENATGGLPDNSGNSSINCGTSQQADGSLGCMCRPHGG